MFRAIQLLLIPLLLFCTSAVAAEAPLGRAVYLETNGRRQMTFSWELARGKELVLTTRDERETFHTHLAPDFQTLAWELLRPEQQTWIKARREGASLTLSGELNGKPMAKSIDLGKIPWYQSLSVSLVRHLPEIGPEDEFWVIRPDTLEVCRMKVSAVVMEPLTVAGETVASWRVEIHPTGLLYAVWRGDYWFRRADRRFLFYRGASGPPGSSPTVITLLDESDS